MKLKNLKTIEEPEGFRNSGAGSVSRSYPSSSNSDVSYRNDAHRSFLQKIVDVRNSVNELPEEVRGRVREMLGQAVCGAMDASRTIYDSLIDPARLKAVDGDYLTDMNGLDELPKWFIPK